MIGEVEYLSADIPVYVELRVLRDHQTVKDIEIIALDIDGREYSDEIPLQIKLPASCANNLGLV